MPEIRIDGIIYQLDAVVKSTSADTLNDFRRRIGNLLRPIEIIVHVSNGTLIVDEHGKHVHYPLLRAGYDGDGPRAAAQMVAMCNFPSYNAAHFQIVSATRMCRFRRRPQRL